MKVSGQILTFINKFYLFGLVRWPSFVPQMKQAFKRYLIPLCILLLGGFINLYADSESNADNQNACYIDGHESLDQQTSLNAIQFGAEKKHYAETEVEEQEEREEEVVSHSTYLQYGGYLTAFFYASETGSFYFEPNSAYSDFQTASLGSSQKRHIRFQVFRI